jgi:putative glutamine amidotransferase
MTSRCVAVSQRVDSYPDRGESRDALDQQLVTWLVQGGFVPVPVPNRLGGEPEVHALLGMLSPCAIVLSGGNDIGMVPERDLTESALISYAEKNDIALLGICRGMQMLAHYSGGKLEPVKNHVRVHHRLNIKQGESLPETVNSFHAWGIRDCPDHWVPIATCVDDGTIEAFSHSFRPWEGWMWHPERNSPFNPMDILRFQALVSHGVKQ